jgi:hypothetical protein
MYYYSMSKIGIMGTSVMVTPSCLTLLYAVTADAPHTIIQVCLLRLRPQEKKLWLFTSVGAYDTIYQSAYVFSTETKKVYNLAEC